MLSGIALAAKGAGRASLSACAALSAFLPALRSSGGLFESGIIVCLRSGCRAPGRSRLGRAVPRVSPVVPRGADLFGATCPSGHNVMVRRALSDAPHPSGMASCCDVPLPPDGATCPSGSWRHGSLCPVRWGHAPLRLSSRERRALALRRPVLPSRWIRAGIDRAACTVHRGNHAAARRT